MTEKEHKEAELDLEKPKAESRVGLEQSNGKRNLQGGEEQHLGSGSILSVLG